MSNTPSVERLLSPESEKLYFFFGGMKSIIGMPPFEFYNASKILNENKIFLRDLSQCWYHCGLQGISNDIDTTTKFIQKEISKINPTKVYFVGNSMGGYAAILFASLTKQGDAIAFAPQTFICPNLRKQLLDTRWSQHISNTYKISACKKKAYDLKPLLSRRKEQRISIFVSKNHHLDYIHANHLRDVPCVNIYEFNRADHKIVRLLRDKGKLPTIMSGNYT